MNDLFHGFEFICAHIYDLIILTTGDWKDHVHKLELSSNKMNQKGLKCNVEYYFFRQTEIEYLVFWVTRDSVKTADKKYKQ